MSMKIKISYEKPQELHTVLKLLRPIIKSYKLSKDNEGKFKRAYINLDTG